MASTGRPTLTTTHGVINRVHRDTSHFGTAATPTRRPCFSQGDVLVVQITDLPYRRSAEKVHPSHFS